MACNKMIALKTILLLFLIGSVWTCPENCIECDPMATMCFVCGSGYELSVMGTCFDQNTISKCTLYGPTGQCFLCQGTYSLDDATGQCEKDYKACLTTQPADDTRCSDCGFGTVLSNGQCLGSINCEQTQNPCTGCKDGFTLRNNECVDETGRCSLVGENGVCETCLQGFKLVGYECLPNDIRNDFCYIYDEEGKCHLCKSGYEAYRDYCFLPRQIVQIQNGDTTIQSILAQRESVRITTTTTTTTTVITPETNSGNTGSSDFGDFGDGFGDFGGGDGFGSFNGDNFGTQTNIQSDDPFCDATDAFNPGRCLFCRDRYTLNSEGRCTEVSPYCDAYNRQNGNCITCRFGITPSNGLCIDSRCLNQGFQRCNNCQPFFTPDLQAAAGYCRYSDSNCLDQAEFRCNICRTGYFVTFEGFCRALPSRCIAANIQTFACLECQTNYSPNSQGICVQTLIQNCFSQSGSTCNQCNTGFQLIGNTCYPLPLNCIQLNPSQPQLCSRCADTYILQNNQCKKEQQPSTPNCQSYNLLTGICTRCLPGYILMGQICVPLPANCIDINQQRRCTQCRQGYSVQNGICVQNGGNIVPNCQSYDPVSNLCTACISGYELMNQQCRLLPPNCMRLNPSIPSLCMTCNNGYELVNQQCQMTVDPNCINYNPVSGVCLECREGFERVNGRCIDSGRRDPNCARYENGICEECSNRYYFGPEGICYPVNPLCRDYDSAGNCMSCYPGYTLEGVNCIIARVEDPFCRQYQNDICSECYTGYYYNRIREACQPLNPLCKTSNPNNGQCQSCYPGYSLINGLCGVSFQDPNCREFNQQKTVCLKCSTRFYPDLQGRCVQISPLCATADQTNGACLSCYPGYTLDGTICVVGGASNTDVNCKEFVNGRCDECYRGHFVNTTTGRCQAVNLLCKTSNPLNGACTSCFPGYAVVGTTCVVSSSSNDGSDANCRETNANGICLDCFSGYYLTVGRRCQRMDPLCRTYTPNNASCASCYEGYTQLNGQCVISTQVPDANNDPYCIKASGTQCIDCAQGYYKREGICTQLNPVCRTSDMTNGECLSCYDGYQRSAGTCVVAAPIIIPYCLTVSNRVCIECINGYYTKDGGCALANTLCSSYDPTNGNCFGCVSGYVFQEGGCIYPTMGVDPNCEYYTGSFCSRCRPTYALINYVCGPIDPDCIDFNQATNSCRECRDGKVAMGPSCI